MLYCRDVIYANTWLLQLGPISKYEDAGKSAELKSSIPCFVAQQIRETENGYASSKKARRIAPICMSGAGSPPRRIRLQCLSRVLCLLSYSDDGMLLPQSCSCSLGPGNKKLGCSIEPLL